MTLTCSPSRPTASAVRTRVRRWCRLGPCRPVGRTNPRRRGRRPRSPRPGSRVKSSTSVVGLALVDLHPGVLGVDAEEAGGAAPAQPVLAGFEGEGGDGQVAHAQSECLSRPIPESAAGSCLAASAAGVSGRRQPVPGRRAGRRLDGDRGRGHGGPEAAGRAGGSGARPGRRRSPRRAPRRPGPRTRRADGGHTGLALLHGLHPAGPAIAADRPASTVPGRAPIEREQGALGHDPSQAVGRLERQHAAAAAVVSATYSCTLSPVSSRSASSAGRASARSGSASAAARPSPMSRSPSTKRPSSSRPTSPWRPSATARRWAVARGRPVAAISVGQRRGAGLERVEDGRHLVDHAGLVDGRPPSATLVPMQRAYHLTRWEGRAHERRMGALMGATLPQKVWDRHVVRAAPGEPDLLYIDLHLVHEVTSPQAFDGLRIGHRRVRRPDLTVATEDHNVPTADIDQPIADPVSARQVEVLAGQRGGVRHHPLPDGRPRPGHRPRHRPGAGPHAARDDHRVRGLPHRHPRRVRRAGVRHRHVRGRARAGHARPCPRSGPGGWRSTSRATCRRTSPPRT